MTKPKYGTVKTGISDNLEGYLNTGDGPVARWLREQAVDGQLSLHPPDVVLLDAEARWGSAHGQILSNGWKLWMKNLGPEWQKRYRPIERIIRSEVEQEQERMVVRVKARIRA